MSNGKNEAPAKTSVIKYTVLPGGIEAYKRANPGVVVPDAVECSTIVDFTGMSDEDILRLAAEACTVPAQSMARKAMAEYGEKEHISVSKPDLLLAQVKSTHVQIAPTRIMAIDILNGARQKTGSTKLVNGLKKATPEQQAELSALMQKLGLLA